METTLQETNLAQLRRFLYLGDECQSFPKSVSHPFSPERTQCINDLSADYQSSTLAMEEIFHAYKEGHYLGKETVISALVMLAKKSKSCEFIKILSEICSSADMVLTFTHLYKEASKPSGGWGRAHRTFLMNFYNGRDAKDLAVEVTKVKSRHKWTHKDVLCMAHVKAKNPETATVLKYLVKGLQVAKKDCEGSETPEVLSYLESVYELSHTTDTERAARIIEIHNLCLEQVPSNIVKSKEVSLCLIPKVPLRSLLELLPRFNKVGLLKPNSPHYNAVIERLNSDESKEALTTDNIGPLETFLTIRRWQISNKIVPGKSMMRQSTPALDEALQNVHLASFMTIRASEKRYLVVLDTNLTMNLSKCAGCSAVTPSHISDLILMALMKSETSLVTSVVFSVGEVVPVEIDNTMFLSDVVERLSEIPAGPAILSAPINWALTRKMPFDTFLVFSDRFTSTQDNDLANVFTEYKSTMCLPKARYILSTLCDETSSFPHEDPSYLNLVGFNKHLLKIIQDFSLGVF